mmetsp:Transcript_18300/g.39329  ORF Transcript_18300/g.39329 Transcript_18300/m.39329 type:complete len:83 (-) Transcript_18300:52-300(-)
MNGSALKRTLPLELTTALRANKARGGSLITNKIELSGFLWSANRTGCVEAFRCGDKLCRTLSLQKIHRVPTREHIIIVGDNL